MNKYMSCLAALLLAACSSAGDDEAVDTTLPNEVAQQPTTPTEEDFDNGSIAVENSDQPVGAYEYASDDLDGPEAVERPSESYRYRDEEPVEDEGDPAPPSAPAWTASEEQAIAVVMKRNEQCRGGSGDETATQLACQLRDNAMAKLRGRGICYGKHGQYGSEMEYHRCDENSL